MNLEEANQLLDAAPCGDVPSRLNPGISQKQSVEIVRRAVNGGVRAFLSDGVTLDPLLEKRVHQVNKNQKRPRY
jgi:hypothetical protein